MWNFERGNKKGLLLHEATLLAGRDEAIYENAKLDYNSLIINREFSCFIINITDFSPIPYFVDVSENQIFE